MTATKYELHTSADPMITRIIPELAKEIGLNESIVLLQIAFWVKTANHEHDGEYWTFQSLREMHKKAFSYWSIDTISRTINSLIDKEYIKSRDDLNKRQGDKTRWFALNIEALSKLQSITVVQVETKGVRKSDRVSESHTTASENRTTLPEITPEKEKVEEAPSEPPPPQIESTHVPFHMAHGLGIVSHTVESTSVREVREHPVFKAFERGWDDLTPAVPEHLTAIYKTELIALQDEISKGKYTLDDVEGVTRAQLKKPRTYDYRITMLRTDMPGYKANQRVAGRSKITQLSRPESRPHVAESPSDSPASTPEERLQAVKAAREKMLLEREADKGVA